MLFMVEAASLNAYRGCISPAVNTSTNSGQPASAGTVDLKDRCNDLGPSQANQALRQVASEEVSLQEGRPLVTRRAP